MTPPVTFEVDPPIPNVNVVWPLMFISRKVGAEELLIDGAAFVLKDSLSGNRCGLTTPFSVTTIWSLTESPVTETFVLASSTSSTFFISAKAGERKTKHRTAMTDKKSTK